MKILLTTLLLALAGASANAEPLPAWMTIRPDARWQDMPQQQRSLILLSCRAIAKHVWPGGVDDYSQQADYFERHLDGWARLQKLLPPEEAPLVFDPQKLLPPKED